MMTFEEFWHGEPLHYMGSDGIEYIAEVHITWSVRQVIITRADGKNIEVRGKTYRSYPLPEGRHSAINKYVEAIRYPVPCQHDYIREPGHSLGCVTYRCSKCGDGFDKDIS